LVITKLDRLGRSIAHLVQLAAELRRREIDLRVIDQGIDTATPGGRLFFHILAAIAEFERELIGERTRDGLTAARARGRKGGRPTVMDATRTALAQQMYDSGVSPTAIAQTLRVARGTLYRHLQTGVRSG
jgi:DNA invertase Pin-like site-specific DNA recombinase